jgi:hypothetical protein
MRRSDEVFFFTLIDFLLQVFFFGLFVFVVSQALKSEVDTARAAQERDSKRLLEATGISNIAELTDLLSKMVPLDKLRGIADFIARNGGEEGLQNMVKAATLAGGAQQLTQLAEENSNLVERVARLEGWAKPSCLPNVIVEGRLQPKVIATAIVADDSISIENPTAEFEQLLNRHGLDFASVQTLSLERFRSTFSPIVVSQPSCRYFLTLRQNTRYYEPIRVLWSVFRTQSR